MFLLSCLECCWCVFFCYTCARWSANLYQQGFAKNVCVGTWYATWICLWLSDGYTVSSFNLWISWFKYSVSIQGNLTPRNKLTVKNYAVWIACTWNCEIDMYSRKVDSLDAKPWGILEGTMEPNPLFTSRAGHPHLYPYRYKTQLPPMIDLGITARSWAGELE